MQLQTADSFYKHKSALLWVEIESLHVVDVSERLANEYDIEPSDIQGVHLEKLFTEQTLDAVKNMKEGQNFPLATVSQTTFQSDFDDGGNSRAVRVNVIRTNMEGKGALLLQLEALEAGKETDSGLKNSFFNHLLYHFPDTIYFKDLESRFLLVNSKQSEVLGLEDPGEAIGRTDFDFFPEEEAEDSYRDEQYIIEAGESIENKREKVTTDDNREYWVSTTKVPLRDENGEVIGTMGVTRDITERKKLEEDNQRLLEQERELRERIENAYKNLQIQKQQFQGAFEKAAIGMALVSKEGEFIRVNDSLCNMLGYRSTELMDKTFQEITHPDDLEKDLEQVNRLLEGEDQSYTMEKRYYHKNGEIIWAILSVSLVRDSDGHPLHFVSQIQDITERKEYEQQMNRSLEEKQVLLEEIHHRVKNNLASVSGILELQIYNTEDDEVKKEMQDAQSRIYTMALVHEQLYQHDSLSNITLGDYAEQLVESVNDSLNTRNKDIQIHIESEEVPLDITRAVPCGLILNELITNIYKHGFEGRESGNIWIKIKQSDQNVHVLIADDGVGLPDDFSLDNQDTLGLNLLNTLLDQLEADMSYENDGGAKFEFVFPRSG